ncbi:MAG: aspartyl/asparaginyl beta-hydroxylase domain-containing protein [Alphaproteobacteria bacterium]|nr:aspartyl/asparaginyl beta-hydroxylase domain-containing protein [Alphaproteobacteria bacterium]MBV9692332.1 aspartyl/asparaginyl beta-hydroxylase domain-containing protein [Alphaproteobacteria bacterium]
MASGISNSTGDNRAAALAQTAQQLMRERRLDEAAAAWQSVLALVPDHPQALLHLGQHHLFRRQRDQALAFLQRAEAADPRNPVVPLNIAFVHRAAGEADKEMAALTRSLALDPYFFPALLAKAMLLERGGERRRAAQVFKDVLTIAPPREQLTPELSQALDHARKAVDDNAAELDAHLSQALEPVRARHDGNAFERFDECRDIMLGRAKAHTHQPTLLLVPRLPAIPFYDNADFPWLAKLEAATETIREELIALAREDGQGFAPYVDHPEGSPLNQWAPLNRSMKWNASFLWKDGERIEAHCHRCPKTAALLDGTPMAEIPGYAPTAFFSVLQPRTEIPPHTGVTNARLIVHLPLIVPGNCRFRVGNVTREWRQGEAWVFDDTIEHAAYNDSDEIRIILIFDIWNPLLSAAEREMICGLLSATRRYYGELPAASF